MYFVAGRYFNVGYFSFELFKKEEKSIVYSELFERKNYN